MIAQRNHFDTTDDAWTLLCHFVNINLIWGTLNNVCSPCLHSASESGFPIIRVKVPRLNMRDIGLSCNHLKLETIYYASWRVKLSRNHLEELRYW